MPFQPFTALHHLRAPLLFLLFSVSAPAQTQSYSAKAALAFETYAYLRGQNAALKEVSRQFPQLHADVKAAEKSLQASYGRAAANISRFLKEELRPSHLTVLEKQIDSLLEQQLKNPIEEKHARDFIASLKQKAALQNTTAVQKSIISFIYHDAPHQEIIDGHLNIFMTENHPKADKADLQIPIPKSWLAEEAENPQTIQQFTSCSGTGDEKIIVMAFELPDSMRGMVLSSETVSDMLPLQSRLLRSETLEIGKLPGIMIEAEEIITDGGRRMKIRMLQFMAIQESILYCIQGSIGPVKAEKNLDSHIKKYEPLFRLVAANTEIDRP